MNTLAHQLDPTAIAGTGVGTGPLGSVDRFVASLGACELADLHTLAEAVDGQVDCAEGEVAWWRATAEVASALRRQRTSREAGRAARRARDAVMAASARTGFRESERDRSTRLARAAGEVARALSSRPVPTSAVETLLAPFARTLPPVAAEPRAV